MASLHASFMEHLPAALYYVAMSSALFVTAPLLSRKAINRSTKAALAFLLGVMMSMVQDSPAPVPSGDLILISLSGFIIGAYIGFVFTFAVEAIIFAGTLMSYSSQLGFANMVDSSTGLQNSVLQRLVYYYALLMFIGIGGIEMMVIAMASAPDMTSLLSMDLQYFIRWSGLILLFGLFMALPVMMSAYLINIGMAVVTKTAPSMNVFSIGFPVVLLSTLILLFVYVPSLMSSFHYYLLESLNRAL